MTKKVYQLDPRLKHLLSDHYKGWIWVRTLTRNAKYKGKIVFVSDLAVDIQRGALRRKNLRHLHHQLIEFSRHGYIFSNTHFIKLLEEDEYTAEGFKNAVAVRDELINREKLAVRQEATIKRMKAIWGPDHVIKGKGHISRGSRPMLVWVWSFQHTSGKKAEHVFTCADTVIEQVVSKRLKRVRGVQGKPSTGPKYVHDGIRAVPHSVQVGRISRRDFCELHNLQYSRMSELAAGKIKRHRGWTLLGTPRRLTHDDAKEIRILMDDGVSYDEAIIRLNKEQL